MVDKRKDGNTADKDEARTPGVLFRKLDERYHLLIDAAATSENSLCPYYLEDSLNVGWAEAIEEVEIHHEQPAAIWCNAPYSHPNIERFVTKAAYETQNGATVVMLLPADTGTRTFRHYIMGRNDDGTKNNHGASEVIFLYPRVTFNNPDGTSMKGTARNASMIVVFEGEDKEPKFSVMRWNDVDE